MKLDAIKKRLACLEARAHSGQVKTTDDDGRKIWIKGSGLAFIRKILKVERALGREAQLEDLPEDLQREARLWNRAKLSDCGLSNMLKDTCRGLIDETG